MTPPLLSLSELTKNYGALKAVDDVTLDFYTGQIHAIIGPNGAGKTTLINLLSGDVQPSAGTIHYKGCDITALPHHRVSRLGIGRSYQKTNVFTDRSCLDNCRIGAQSLLASSFRFWRAAEHYADVEKRAFAALETCHLGPRADDLAASLSHGEQRQLEIAMVLATAPDLLLLDEPLAGMGTAESKQAADLIQRLGQNHTVVLIEHDMDAVFRIADRLSVLVNGRIIATDTPEAIRADAAVQDAYLGHGGERTMAR